MKTTIPFLILASAAFALASCSTTGSNTAMVPLRSVEDVERQAPVTYNPNGIAESLDARNAVNYSSSRRFGLGYGF